MPPKHKNTKSHNTLIIEKLVFSGVWCFRALVAKIDIL